ncbi:helix-turn-helix transcriptional regulator [Pseudoclavibacter soli]|uniref:helix-turn-helix transcriptional regulator n=1 Tax=Pseudoclavibacter soli TaxID=452623 RepID=UPI000412CB49|nr:helix-turn-helix domain-containing protein [Pseudoclavibacter soli]
MTQNTTAELPLLTIKDLASLLNVSEKTIRNLRAKGQGPRAVKIGGSVRWRRETVDRYLEDMEAADLQEVA